MARTGHPSRKEEILDRALEVIQEVGLARMTTRRISERVGFTEAALFRYFPSKKALLLGLMTRLEGMLLDPIRVLADSDRPAAEKLTAILEHHVQLIRRHNSLPMLLLAEATATGDPRLLERMRGILREYLEILRVLVAELGDAGTEESPDDDCLALLLFGIPSALAIRHRLLPDPATEQRVAGRLVPYVVALLTEGRTS